MSEPKNPEDGQIWNDQGVLKKWDGRRWNLLPKDLQALEVAKKIAIDYGKNRPLLSSSERSMLIRGRYEGEQAASSNIARLIEEEAEKPEPTRIVFLDIDGPMCSPRGVMASGAMGVTRYFDPVAVGFLNQLFMAAPYRLVITSTWRKEVYMPILLQSCGVLAPCHKDWATTEDEVEGATSSMGDRPYQIDHWMHDHELLVLNQYKQDLKMNPWEPLAGTKVLIIDDDSFQWHEWQKDCWIKADRYDGIPLMSMQRAFDLFEVEWPAKNRAYPA